MAGDEGERLLSRVAGHLLVVESVVEEDGLLRPGLYKIAIFQRRGGPTWIVLKPPLRYSVTPWTPNRLTVAGSKMTFFGPLTAARRGFVTPLKSTAAKSKGLGLMGGSYWRVWWVKTTPPVVAFLKTALTNEGRVLFLSRKRDYGEERPPTWHR